MAVLPSAARADQLAALLALLPSPSLAMFRLTVYDAAYLEFAQRRGLPLAT
jgi:predicted nucleic acid-binding protein